MKRFLPIFLLMLTALTACGFSPSASTDTEGQAVSTLPCECTYYEPERLEMYTEAAERDEALAGMRAAIVPHYAPELAMLCKILVSIDSVPDTFVIIAPDHPAVGTATVSTSDWYWGNETIPCHRKLAESLAAECGIDANSTLDESEWSAAILLPYIHYYFPDAAIVIVYVSRAASPSVLRDIAEHLAASDENIFLLGSADFSHDQDAQTAAENDKYTQSVIEAMDVGTLLQLGNEYLDSPQTVSVLIKYAAAQNLSLTLYDSAVDPYVENGKILAGSYQCYTAK